MADTPGACDHEWINPENEVVTVSGPVKEILCRKCGSWRSDEVAEGLVRLEQEEIEYLIDILQGRREKIGKKLVAALADEGETGDG